MSIPAQALRREQHTRDMLNMLIDASKVCMTWLRLERHGGAPNDQEACERSHALLDRSLRDGRRARRLRARCLEGRGSLAWLCLALAARLTRSFGDSSALLEVEPSQRPRA